MEPEVVAILGAGSVDCMPWIVATLASYFGERPLALRFWDADPERLDLFDRLARLCFTVNRSEHGLVSTDDVNEAQDGADRLVLALDEHCARKYLKANRRHGGAELDGTAMIEMALESLLRLPGESAEVLSLLPREVFIPVTRYRRLDWPPRPTESERTAVPHQVLRLLHGDEYSTQFLAEHEGPVFKRWLESPLTVELSTSPVE